MRILTGGYDYSNLRLVVVDRDTGVEMRYRFISMESCPKDSYHSIITLESIPNRVARLFGAKPQILKFRGSSTVWYSFPEFERQGTFMEARLCNTWERERFKAMPAQK